MFVYILTKFNTTLGVFPSLEEAKNTFTSKYNKESFITLTRFELDEKNGNDVTVYLENGGGTSGTLDTETVKYNVENFGYTVDKDGYLVFQNPRSDLKNTVYTDKKDGVTDKKDGGTDK